MTLLQLKYCIFFLKFFLCFFFVPRVTINKTSDLENNTDTLKKLSAYEKPNNQTKLATMGGTPLPPGQLTCNILKGANLSLYTYICSGES